MKMSEISDRLKRLTPDCIRGREWYMERGQPGIFVLFLENRVSIDRIEVVDKTDKEVKKLILSRISDTLICALNEVEKQLDELGDE